jgi:hypothetical protein
VLWQKNYTHINGAPVDALIRDVLIEERAGITSYNKDSYALKWTFLNEKDLVFVVMLIIVTHCLRCNKRILMYCICLDCLPKLFTADLCR